jgi:hypothetical protein
VFVRNEARPFDFDAVPGQYPAVGRPDFRIRQPQHRQEAAIRVPDQMVGPPASQLQFVTTQESTIVIIEAESMSRFERRGTIRFTEKKYVAVLDHDRARDAARDRSRAGNQFMLIVRK